MTRHAVVMNERHKSENGGIQDVMQQPLKTPLTQHCVAYN